MVYITAWRDAARKAVVKIAPNYPIKSVRFCAATSSSKTQMERLWVVVELDEEIASLMDCCDFQNKLADKLKCEVKVELYPYTPEGYDDGKGSILYERE